MLAKPCKITTPLGAPGEAPEVVSSEYALNINFEGSSLGDYKSLEAQTPKGSSLTGWLNCLMVGVTSLATKNKSAGKSGEC